VPVQKIVAASGQANGSLVLVVSRYNMDGSADTSFNGNGVLVTNIAGDMHGMAVQSDGKILLAASTTGATVVRVNTDGTLDTSFGSGGIATISPARRSAADGFAVTPQSDGKIVLAGDTGGTPTIWRFTTDGKLDTTFGSGGAATILNVNSPRALALQNMNGQQMIVVAGFTSTATKGKNIHDVFAVGRLTSSGQVDTTFGSGGSVLHDFAGHTSLIMGLAIDSTNRIVAAGYADLTGTTGGTHVAVARYNTDGSADSGFGTNGYSTFAMLPNSSYGWSVALQADGKIVVGGFSTPSSGPTQMVVARLITSGAPDGNFGTGGYAIVDFSPLGYTGGYGYAVLVQPDGKVVVAGTVTAGTGAGGVALARYWP